MTRQHPEPEFPHHIQANSVDGQRLYTQQEMNAAVAAERQRAEQAEAELAQRKGWQRCDIHQEINADHAWGCPDCLVELRRENGRLRHELSRAGAILGGTSENVPEMAEIVEAERERLAVRIRELEQEVQRVQEAADREAHATRCVECEEKNREIAKHIAEMTEVQAKLEYDLADRDNDVRKLQERLEKAQAELDDWRQQTIVAWERIRELQIKRDHLAVLFDEGQQRENDMANRIAELLDERERLAARCEHLGECLSALLDGLDANTDERCGITEAEWEKRIRRGRDALAALDNAPGAR